MEHAFKVNIYIPEKLFLSTEATYLAVPGLDGGFGLMKDHTPCVIALLPGIITLTREEKKQSFSTGSGFLEMRDNIANLFLNSCKEI